MALFFVFTYPPDGTISYLSLACKLAFGPFLGRCAGSIISLMQGDNLHPMLSGASE